MILSALLDYIQNDLSCTRQKWSVDKLDKNNTEVYSPCSTIDFQLIYFCFVTIVWIYSATKIKGVRDQEKVAKFFRQLTSHDQKMVSHLPQFDNINDLFKVPIYCLLWINGILLVQRISTYHRNLIGKSSITCLKNNKSCSRLWCLVPRSVANLVSAMYHTVNCFGAIMNASCKNPLPPSHKTWSPFLKSPGYFLGPKSHLQLLVWTSRESFFISRICAHIKQPCNHKVWDFAMTFQVWNFFGTIKKQVQVLNKFSKNIHIPSMGASHEGIPWGPPMEAHGGSWFQSLSPSVGDVVPHG